MSINFEDRIKDLADSDRDALLAGIWSNFKDTDAHQALVWTLKSMHAPALTQALHPDATDSKRAFSAGAAWATMSLLHLLQVVTNIDLSSLGKSDEPPAGTEDYIQKEEVPY